jgi:protein-glutamine gamma-glutamyltransferase
MTGSDKPRAASPPIVHLPRLQHMPRLSRARLATALTRDKADTLVLLFSSILVLAPHAGHLPLWISAVCAAALAWRALITLQGTRMPPLWLLLPVALLAMGGVYATFHTLLGRDAGVAMLVLLLVFKLLEMHARRDLFVVIFLSFFLVLTNFFYSQSMLTALAMVATIIALMTAQLSFQYTGAVPPLKRRVRLAATIFALAAPLALLLFVLFPRIQGPLWGLPGDAHGGRSGLSESMAPGNISNLALSDEAAFRVKFLDPAPPQSRLYWRGIVLGDYDGRTWTRVRPWRRPAAGERPSAIQVRGPAVRQQITQEPSAQRWLFALEMTRQVPTLGASAAAMSAEGELSASVPISGRVRYDVQSHLEFRVDANAAPDALEQWLALPAGFNPRTVAWAGRMSRGRDPGQRIDAVLKMFRQDKFVYTLQAPLLGTDAVDEFLFQTRAGFCEHYAGAFVVLMRAMDIPARVVTGYQGGEANPVDGVMTVRQSDAHAWAEVWLAARGWVRIDPTAAIAPERVEKNLARALPRRPPFGIAALGGFVNFQLDANSWLATLRFYASAASNSWNQWALDYNPERQRALLQALAAGLFNWRTALGMASIMAVLFLARALRSRKRPDPVDALYFALCQLMARRGFAREPDEGPHGYAQRLARASAAPGPAIARFLRLYGEHKYGAGHPLEEVHLIKTLKSLLSKIR